MKMELITALTFSGFDDVDIGNEVQTAPRAKQNKEITMASEFRKDDYFKIDPECHLV
jgi:hypothetical protein